jgi:hypothetical protein
MILIIPILLDALITNLFPDQLFTNVTLFIYLFNQSINQNLEKSPPPLLTPFY